MSGTENTIDRESSFVKYQGRLGAMSVYNSLCEAPAFEKEMHVSQPYVLVCIKEYHYLISFILLFVNTFYPDHP